MPVCLRRNTRHQNRAGDHYASGEHHAKGRSQGRCFHECVNSTCYYFTDELYGLLSAAGYENAVLGLVYYSGCSIKQHYDWWKTGQANYEFRVLDKDGLHSMEGYSLSEEKIGVLQNTAHEAVTTFASK